MEGSSRRKCAVRSFSILLRDNAPLLARIFLVISGSDLRFGPFQHTTNHWQDVDDDTDPDRYKSEYTYDANGNIERTAFPPISRGSSS